MAKKIVILNGSPRKTGNTSSLTAAFAEGAKAAGNEVTEFHLASMNIRGCLGCWGGGKVLCPWVTQPGDTKEKPALKEAYDLGYSIH